MMKRSAMACFDQGLATVVTWSALLSKVVATKVGETIRKHPHRELHQPAKDDEPV
jgi:hypothetical protein